MYLDGYNTVTCERTRSTLHVIDLAGSERLSHSGATGDRLKEAQAVNKSLSSLAQVFMALQAAQGHVPYRNSKLTHFLKDSLGTVARFIFDFLRVCHRFLLGCAQAAPPKPS